MGIFIKIRYPFIGLIFFLTSVTCHAQVGGVILGKRTSPRGIVSFSENAMLNAAGDNKFVDGYVKKYGNNTFIFPVGDNGMYRPFAAAADQTIGTYFQETPNAATVPSGGPFLVGAKQSDVSTVSAVEFWDIDGTNSTKITLTWNATSNVSGLTNSTLKSLTILGWNTANSKWEKIASTVDPTSILGTASSISTGSITTNLAVVPNTYNIYTLGALSSGPLPVTLLTFKATAGDFRSVKLDWETTSEVNSEKFDIERSQDAKSWILLGSVVANGESSVRQSYRFADQNALSGENFYRLKMIDKDGTFAYSRIENIKIVGGTELVMYPNPVIDRLYFDLPKSTGIKEVSFYNTSGSKVLMSNSVGTSGIDVRNLTSGMYMVNLSFSDGTSQSSKIIVSK